MNEAQMLNAQAQIKAMARELSAIPQRYYMGIAQPQAPIFVKRRPEKYTADWDLLPDGTLKPLSQRAISMEFQMKDRAEFDRLVQIAYGGWPRRTGA